MDMAPFYDHKPENNKNIKIIKDEKITFINNRYFKYYHDHKKTSISEYKNIKYYYDETIIKTNNNDFICFIQKKIECNNMVKNNSIILFYNGNISLFVEFFLI